MATKNFAESGHTAVINSKDPAVTGEFERDTQKIAGVVLQPGLKPGWIFGFTIGFILLQVMLVSLAWLLFQGTGIWGVNNPVGWGLAIINFVWWVGIGHAGTLISAVLLLFRQQWRTSINRFAEAMTLFAVACAAIFPGVHVGRPWFAYWLLPYPSTTGAWPQFRSPLLWDVFAVSTYASVSLLFWYVGLIPDLATFRDRSKSRIGQTLYGIFSLGWIGSARHWKRYTDIYLLLAGLATPLVLSVHTIVSFDFAISQVPGWHATIFPPYFVAGAIFSGFAMVLTLVIPLRYFYNMEEYFTDWHLDCMAKVMLASGLIVGYGYVLEHFVAWYSMHDAEVFMLLNRMGGPYAWSYWMLMLCNIAIPQMLWFAPIRKNVYMLFFISIVVNIGMWLERFVIVITSLHRDYLPGSWGMYYPTIWDWSLYLGTFGLFFSLLFIFLRLLPMITIFEIREEAHHKALHGGDE